MGPFNLRTQIWASVNHIKRGGGGGTNKSAQELTWRHIKTAPHPAGEFEPRVFRFELIIIIIIQFFYIAPAHTSICLL